MKKLTIAALSALSLFAACVDKQSVEQMKTDLKDIKQQQNTLVDKLTKLEGDVKEMKDKVGKAPAPGQPPAEPTGPVEVSAKHGSIKGDPKAPVVIVEWSDFQCPFCSKVIPIIEETMKDPEVAGKVAFVFKQFPLSFHPQAMPAAKASLAAGRQGKFIEMHDKMFANQQQLSDANYEVWAKEIGLDVEKFKKDFADPAIEQQVKDEMAGARRSACAAPRPSSSAPTTATSTLSQRPAAAPWTSTSR
jgi:protein-disulfide isomerase